MIILTINTKQFCNPMCRVEKQKRRMTGFLNKIALKDSTYRHLSVLTGSDMRQMALGFLKVSTAQLCRMNIGTYHIHKG